LRLDLPSTATTADRLAGCVLLGACALAVLCGATQHTAGLALAAASVALTAMQAALWTRSSRAPRPLHLECSVEGGLWLGLSDGSRAVATLGTGTRILGDTLYVDLRYSIDGGRPRRWRSWLTALDVDAHDLRRWTVVLPASGRAASS
jgi:hypothetical protein